MKEKIQRDIFDYFSKKGIENFLGVPDSTMKYFIEQGLEQKKILITTTEEEAMGIGTGFCISKSPQ